MERDSQIANEDSYGYFRHKRSHFVALNMITTTTAINKTACFVYMDLVRSKSFGDRKSQVSTFFHKISHPQANQLMIPILFLELFTTIHNSDNVFLRSILTVCQTNNIHFTAIGALKIHIANSQKLNGIFLSMK